LEEMKTEGEPHIDSAGPGPSRRAALLFIVFVAALALRIGYMSTLEAKYYWPDEKYYAYRASEIRDGTFARESAFDPPGYPYFVALSFKAGGLGLARMLQVILGAVTCVIVAVIGERAFGFGSGLLAGAAYAVYPFAVYLPSVLYPQTVMAFLIALAVLLLLLYRDSRRSAHLIGASVSLGISILFVPPTIILCPVLALWVAWISRPSYLDRLRTVLVMAAFVVVAILPWTIRNYVVLDKFVFLTQGSAQLFYMQNNPYVDPNERDVRKIHALTLTEELREEIRKEGKGREAANRVYKRRAYAFIKTHPGKFARNCLVRLGNFFALKPKLYSKGEHTGSLYKRLSSLSWGPVFLLGLGGAILAGFRKREHLVFALIPLSLGVLYSFFHGSIRYRLPTDPYAILLGSYLVTSAGGRLTRMRKGSEPES